MQKSNRKELVSISLEPESAEIIRLYAKDIYRSTSETVRIIVNDFIKNKGLEKKYCNKK